MSQVLVLCCSYEEEEMQKFVLHLLVLSHSYEVPSLKRVCEYNLERGWLTRENVVDVLQLARCCDAPRLALVCLRMVVRDFKCISTTEGWRVMKRSDPSLEQEMLESVVEADSVSNRSCLSVFVYTFYLLNAKLSPLHIESHHKHLNTILHIEIFDLTQLNT